MTTKIVRIGGKSDPDLNQFGLWDQVNKIKNANTKSQAGKLHRQMIRLAEEIGHSR